MIILLLLIKTQYKEKIILYCMKNSAPTKRGAVLLHHNDNGKAVRKTALPFEQYLLVKPINR